MDQGRQYEPTILKSMNADVLRSNGCQSIQQSITEIRCAAHQRGVRIRENKALSEFQRKLALEILRNQTEVQLRTVLGQREFSAFRAFHAWWFRQLGE
jgi:hypothetical protein